MIWICNECVRFAGFDCRCDDRIIIGKHTHTPKVCPYGIEVSIWKKSKEEEEE
jgi:hypothetical protein